MTFKHCTPHVLGKAVCAHFNLPPDQVSIPFEMKGGKDELLSVTLTIALDSKDLKGIGEQLEKIENA